MLNLEADGENGCDIMILESMSVPICSREHCALTISGRRGGTNETANSHQQKSLLDAFKELIGCSEQ